MTDRSPISVVQPGMTAWGRAAERELEAYRRQTSFNSPADLTDQVMALIEAESLPRRRWILPVPAVLSRRIRMTGGIVAVLFAMLGGAALVAGASGLIGLDLGAPIVGTPDNRPILVAEPTDSTTEPVDPTPDTSPDSAEPFHAPEPNLEHAVEVPIRPEVEKSTEGPEESEAEETDEPEAMDDDGGEGQDGPEGSDEADDDGSVGGPVEGSDDGDADEPAEP